MSTGMRRSERDRWREIVTFALRRFRRSGRQSARQTGRCALGVVLAIWLPLTASAKMSVLTSFLPFYCFAANVAGDAAEVENLLPPGVEPHDYQMTMRDRQKIGGANLIILNGLGIEAWLEPVLKMRSGFTPVIASAGLSNEAIWIQKGDRNAAAQESRGPKRGPKGLPKPHIWLDPILAMHAVSNIQGGFGW